MVTKPNRALAFRGGDIHKFTHGLALAAERLGVHTLYGQDVQSVQSDGNKAIVVTTSQDNASDNASENASGKAQSFDGIVVCAGAPSVSLLDDETKLVTSRLGADRIAPLINWVAQCFPNIDTR